MENNTYLLSPGNNAKESTKTTSICYNAPHKHKH